MFIRSSLKGFSAVRQHSVLSILLVVSLLQLSCVSNTSDNLIRPPFLQGKRFLVSQAFNNDQTHKGLLNRYAVDLVMPEGEPVCAASAGKVVAVKNRGKGSHYVRIQHADGWISDYQHLRSGSITVKVGQAVKFRQCFAQVGSTGSIAGPHLHFAMLRNVAGVYVSKPFKFISPGAPPYAPKYLKWVYN